MIIKVLNGVERYALKAAAEKRDAAALELQALSIEIGLPLEVNLKINYQTGEVEVEDARVPTAEEAALEQEIRQAVEPILARGPAAAEPTPITNRAGRRRKKAAAGPHNDAVAQEG